MCVHLCLKVRGFHWVSPLVAVHVIFWTKSLTELRTHRFGCIDWPASPRGPPVLASPVMGLLAYATMPSVLCWFLRLNSDSLACVAGILSTDLYC